MGLRRASAPPPVQAIPILHGCPWSLGQQPYLEALRALLRSRLAANAHASSSEPRFAESGAPSPQRPRHSASEGYTALVRAGLSLPALVALVNHRSFAQRAEEWAPALLGLALSELADRGALSFAPFDADGIADGDLSGADFLVGLSESEPPELAKRSAPLAALLQFLVARQSTASARELALAFIAQPDPDSQLEPHGRPFSKFAGLVASELVEAGFKRVFYAPAPERARRSDSPSSPPATRGRRGSAPGRARRGGRGGRGAARLGAADGGPVSAAGPQRAAPVPAAARRASGAAVAAAVLGRALWEAEAAWGALSCLPPDEFGALLGRPLLGGPDCDSAALLLLAIPPALRPRFGPLRARSAGRGPLPGLGRVAEGDPSIDMADAVSRILFISRSEGRPPWGLHTWENPWVAALCREEEGDRDGDVASSRSLDPSHAAADSARAKLT
eukprot:tig00001098_g7073.t1